MLGNGSFIAVRVPSERARTVSCPLCSRILRVSGSVEWSDDHCTAALPDHERRQGAR